MVRLKERASDTGKDRERLFQFHYGTIKSIAGRRAACARCDFNSTMVRLKVGVQCAGGFFLPPFQFHYGTIKS